MRKWVPVAVLIQAAAQGELIRFDHAAEATLPPGWTVAMTHSGGAPKWTIVRDDSAPPQDDGDGPWSGREPTPAGIAGRRANTDRRQGPAHDYFFIGI